MLFYSFEFLFIFLPITLIGYGVISNLSHNRRITTSWLVICSVVFYGMWNISYIPLIIASMIFNYYSGIALQRSALPKKPLLIFSISANLALLAYYKYANFFIDNVNNLASTDIALGTIILPLAISFFTFQQISWLVDSYKNIVNTKTEGFWRYALFVTFFPQLIAGPIVHHSEMMPQFSDKNNFHINWKNINIGLTIFIFGLFKKIVLADSLAPFANNVFNASLSTNNIHILDSWIGMFAYTFQLYFDFSGYADMAIGLALMFNIKLPINFNSPYKASSIIEFWRCWHMTLSRFLKDYLYIPLGGNRKGKNRRYVNLMITMVIGGLWHGAGWTFVFWGFLHGLYLSINHLWQNLSNRLNISPTYKLRIFYRILTLLSVAIAWVFFRAENFSSANNIILGLFGAGGDQDSLIYKSGDLFEISKLLIVSFFICWFMPNTLDFIEKNKSVLEIVTTEKYHINFIKKILSWKYSYFWTLVASVMAVFAIITIISSKVSPQFLYFQF